MSYNEIAEVRRLFAVIPNDVLNSTQRLIILTHVTHENEDPKKGSHVNPAVLSATVGLKIRAYQENLHYLGTGSWWNKETKKREPCKTPNCETHLRIIRTRNPHPQTGSKQTYNIDLEVLKALASMHVGAP
jgi:hypothetical protein